MALREQEITTAARALGARDREILWRHFLPNVLSTVIVAATLSLGNVIILEASLSYLGIGVRPPTPSWGNIIQEGAEQIAIALVDVGLPRTRDRDHGARREHARRRPARRARPAHARRSA